VRDRFLRLAHHFGLGRAIGLSLLLIFFVIRIWDPAPIEELRLRSFDLFQLLMPRVTDERPVTIVDIDEESLGTYGQWPWPRSVIADLVNRLTDMQSAAIAFDVVFSEPDRLSPANAAKLLPDLDEAIRAKLFALPSNDEILAAAIGKSRVVLGQSGLPKQVERPNDRVMPQTGVATLGPDPSPFLVTFPGLLHNVPLLENAAAGRGLFSILQERDGIVRRVPIVMRANDQIVPSLSFELLRVATNSGTILLKTNDAGVISVAVPGLTLPTDRNGRVWVHFSRPQPDIYVSAKDILEGSVAPERIAGKLILVGTSSVGLFDIKTTPVARAMPGVEIHAQIIEAALTNSVLTHPPYAIGVELVVAFLLGIAIIVLAPMVSALTLLILGGGVAAGLVAFSWFLFHQHDVLLDVTFALISTFSIYTALVFVNYIREQLDRQRIRSAFGQYLSPTLVAKLAQNPDKLVLGGEERIMTVMFSDVRGFTGISELYKDDPQGLTQMMNRLLTPLTNAILDRSGTIDKYMGDAIMAFWNAPLDDAAHEANACEAALDMLERLRVLNDERKQEAESDGKVFIPIKIGIGINTGKCVVGNMGSDLRFQYSVLGDSVNLASRLEGQTKSYDVPILIGTRTAEAVKDRFAILELDCITVKGKTEPEVVYTILGRKEAGLSSTFEAVRASVNHMLASYRARDWTSAIKAAQACRTANGMFHLGGIVDLYVERIEAFQHNPPPSDWNGVFALQIK
jgi:adenylate cyclase